MNDHKVMLSKFGLNSVHGHHIIQYVREMALISGKLSGIHGAINF